MEQATRNIGKDDSITDEEREMLPMQQQQFLTMPPELHPKTLTNDTFTAWEKKPSKEKIKIPPQRPPQDKVVPVNFSVPESRHPKQIAAVETVEPEAKPRGLEVHVLSTSKDAKDLTAAPTQPSPEPTQEEMASPSCRPGATCQTIHEKLPEETEPPSTVKLSSTVNALWNLGRRISHWRTARSRGYHLDQITRDSFHKQAILKHERDTKEAVPLPLQEMIEEEVLVILKETQKSYQKNLGVNHPLTLQLEQQIEKLYLRLRGRGVIN